MSSATLTPQEITAPDYQRRFGGVARLYGKAGLTAFERSRVCVVGIGGVGSWVAEALARSAVGCITLIDLDVVAESNVNRQIHALGDEFGKAKVSAMAERIRAINPACKVVEVDAFISEESVEQMLGQGFDYVIDAIDHARTKAAMIHWCLRRKLPLISIGSAGGQMDPTRIAVADLTRTEQDPLLAKVRSILRKEYGFSRDLKRKCGILAVYSSEPLHYPESGASCDIATAPTGLNCAGFGSSVCVTAPFGFFAAAEVLKRLKNSACPE